jgi:hypothetical protein
MQCAAGSARIKFTAHVLVQSVHSNQTQLSQSTTINGSKVEIQAIKRTDINMKAVEADTNSQLSLVGGTSEI